MSTLLVLVPDSLSEIVRKGEFGPRYYNPGEVFDNVHVLTTVDDRPSLPALQRTVGRARLHVHALPFGAHRHERWLRWATPVLARWASAGVELAREIQPALVRCYGLDVNAYLAWRIGRDLGVPYVVSVHTARDENPEPRTLGRRVLGRLFEPVERRALRDAARVLPVYEAILPQLRRQGASKVEVAYNVINPDCLREKRGYAVDGGLRILTVGRQLPFKSPASIIEAVGDVPAASLTVVGDGPEHASLRALVDRLGLHDRVRFESAIPNDELTASLPGYDVFAAHSEYAEIPKAVLEPLLAGLPVVMNQRRGTPVPELQGDFLMLVPGTREGYRTAFERLAEDETRRATLGRKARDHARSRWDPERTEARMAAIYRDAIQERA